MHNIVTYIYKGKGWQAEIKKAYFVYLHKH